MESENSPITKEEALSSLAEIDRIGAQIRKAVAASRAAPMLMLWGSIWVIGFTGSQFLPHAYRIWLGLDIVGFAISFLSRGSRRSPVKGPHNWRMGLSWLILMSYAALWCSLISPWEMAHAPGWANYAPFMERKMAVLWVTVCMFAYMIMGLWLDRFFLWLGALVTLSALVGYFFVLWHFYLWIGLTGGGSLIASGIFIRKSWR